MEWNTLLGQQLNLTGEREGNQHSTNAVKFIGESKVRIGVRKEGLRVLFGLRPTGLAKKELWAR